MTVCAIETASMCGCMRNSFAVCALCSRASTSYGFRSGMGLTHEERCEQRKACRAEKQHQPLTVRSRQSDGLLPDFDDEAVRNCITVPPNVMPISVMEATVPFND